MAIKTLKERVAFTLINKVQASNITATSVNILITASEEGEAKREWCDNP